MRHVLVWNMTTAAGAGTYAANLIYNNGLITARADYPVPKDMGICKIKMMGAAGVRSTLARSGHPADTLVFPQLADTLADNRKEIDLEDILGGAGIELNQAETLTMTSTVTGNATIITVMELDDSIQRVNVRAPRVAGVNAMVAATPTETGGNLRAALSANTNYELRAIFVTSTSIEHGISRYQKRGAESIEMFETPGALLTGLGNYAKLDRPIKGTGNEFLTDWFLDLEASAADAAATQDIYGIFACN